MSRFAPVAVALVAVSLAACSSARIVHDTRTGGTVAMRGPDGGAHKKAQALMRDKCPSGYTVIEQGEVPYGETSHSYMSFGRPRPMGPGSAFASTSTTQDTEWQVTFQCRGAQASAAPLVMRF